MNKTVKTAISLPKDTFRRAESLRRKAGKSRSELYVDALKNYFKTLEVRELEARYAAGYREKPENMKEISTFVKAGLKSFPPEDW